MAGVLAGTFLALALGYAPAAAGEGMWSLSFRTQGTLDFKPGNDYFLGPELGYSIFHFAEHRFQIKASYLTSRLEQAFQENILKYDFFLVTPIWHFRRNAFFDPTVQVDLGYARFDTEFPEFADLDNSTWVASFQPGLNHNLAQGRFGFHYHLGYNFIAPEGHLIYPGVFGLGVWMML